MEWFIESQGNILCSSPDIISDSILSILESKNTGKFDGWFYRAKLTNDGNVGLFICVQSVVQIQTKYTRQYIKYVALHCRDALLFSQGIPTIHSSWLRNFQTLRDIVKPLLHCNDVTFSKVHCPIGLLLFLQRIQKGANTRVRYTPISIFARYEQLSEWERLEDKMDLLDGILQFGNDTFDEAPLALPVGSCLFMDGVPLHASLCDEDIRLALLLMKVDTASTHDVYQTYDGFKVSVRGIQVPVDMRLGTRLNDFFDPRARLEPRVLVCVKLGRACLVRLFLSQEPGTDVSGHIDPFGILLMSRTLREVTSDSSLTGIHQAIRDAFDKIEAILTQKTIQKQENDDSSDDDDTASQTPSEAQTVSRPVTPRRRPQLRQRSNSDIWERMKRIGRSISSRSLDIGTPPPEETKDETEDHQPTDDATSFWSQIDRMITLANAEPFRDFIRRVGVYVTNDQQSLPENERVAGATPPNPFSLATLVANRGIKAKQIEQYL